MNNIEDSKPLSSNVLTNEKNISSNVPLRNSSEQLDANSNVNEPCQIQQNASSHCPTQQNQFLSVQSNSNTTQKFVLNIATDLSSAALVDSGTNSSGQAKILTFSTTNGKSISVPPSLFRQIVAQQQQSTGGTGGSGGTTTISLVPVATQSGSSGAQTLMNSELASLLSNNKISSNSIVSSSSSTLSPTSSTLTITDVSCINPTQTSTRFVSKVPISDDGMGHCKRCGAIGVKDTFYGKGKQFCSSSCARGTVPSSKTANSRQPLFKFVKMPIKSMQTQRTSTTTTNQGQQQQSFTSTSNNNATNQTSNNAVQSSPTMVVSMPMNSGSPSAGPNTSNNETPSIKVSNTNDLCEVDGPSGTTHTRLIIRPQQQATVVHASGTNIQQFIQQRQQIPTIDRSINCVNVNNQKNINRNYSKIQVHQLQQHITPTIAGVNVNQNDQNLPTQATVVQQVPGRRTKRSNNNQTLNTGKRSRSKAGPVSCDSERNVSYLNSTLLTNGGCHDESLKDTNHSILISQLKKPVACLADNQQSPLIEQTHNNQYHNGSNIKNEHENNKTNHRTISILEQIKRLDAEMLNMPTVDHQSNYQCNGHGGTLNMSNYQPPIWWSIFDKYGFERCAPVSAFVNAPLCEQWPELIGNDRSVYVEINLTEQEFKIAASNNNLKNGHFSQTFWFAKIVGHSGYYLKLCYVGLAESNSFWINIRLRNVYPIGYARNNNFEYRMPKQVCEMNSNHQIQQIVRSLTRSGSESIHRDLFGLFQQQIQTDLKVGLKVETIDKNRYNCFRVATIQQVIGGRCLLRYDGEPPTDDANGCWNHIHSEQIRPVGWSYLVGHKLFASTDYAMKSLQLAVQNVKHHIDTNKNRNDWNKLGVLKKFEFINKYSLFREGMKLEVVNPWQLSSICVATIRKVLRFNYIVLSIDDYINVHDQLQEERMFTLHSSSAYLLPAGFCKTYSIPLSIPNGYNREFDWSDYCRQTNSLIAPADFFSYKHFPGTARKGFLCQFEEGMLVEAVDMMVPNLLCVAVIKRRCARLLLLHFIGWDDSYDQWTDCCSANILPVGYCDLVEYPLQAPPTQQNSSSNRKYRRNNSQSYKRNKKTNSLSPSNKSIQMKSSLIDVKSSDQMGNAVQQPTQIDSQMNSVIKDDELNDDNDGDFNELDLPQTLQRANSEMYNFLSWSPSVTNFGRFEDHNKYLMPLKSKFDIGNGRWIQFSDPWLQQDRLQIQLSNDSMSFDIEWHELPSLNLDEKNHLKVYDSFYYFNPKDLDDYDGSEDFHLLPHWSPQQVSKFMYRSGFADVCDSILVYKVDGKRLLSLSGQQALQLALTASSTNRLIMFLDSVQKRFNMQHHHHHHHIVTSDVNSVFHKT